jgi:hypothetical protein
VHESTSIISEPSLGKVSAKSGTLLALNPRVMHAARRASAFSGYI